MKLKIFIAIFKQRLLLIEACALINPQINIELQSVKILLSIDGGGLFFLFSNKSPRRSMFSLDVSS